MSATEQLGSTQVANKDYLSAPESLALVKNLLAQLEFRWCCLALATAALLVAFSLLRYEVVSHPEGYSYVDLYDRWSGRMVRIKSLDR